GPLPFGQIDLHVWATAVKRPQLGPTPAKPREPYAVAELFRQALDYADRFRRRTQQSTRRLMLTVGAAVGMAGVMAAAAVALFLLGPTAKPPKLLNDVEAYFSNEPKTPSDRLRGDLQREIGILGDFKNNRDFPRLSQELQNEVLARLKEYEEYK